MKRVILELVSSKKFLATVTATIVYAAGRLGLRVDEQLLDHVYWALLAYVGAQGVADAGKSAALVNSGRIEAIAGRVNTTDEEKTS